MTRLQFIKFHVKVTAKDLSWQVWHQRLLWNYFFPFSSIKSQTFCFSALLRRLDDFLAIINDSTQQDVAQKPLIKYFNEVKAPKIRHDI